MFSIFIYLFLLKEEQKWTVAKRVNNIPLDVTFLSLLRNPPPEHTYTKKRKIKSWNITNSEEMINNVIIPLCRMFAWLTHWKVCGMRVTLSSTQFVACGWVSGSLGWSCMTTRDSGCGKATEIRRNWQWRWARSADWRRPWPPKRWRSAERSAERWIEQKINKSMRNSTCGWAQPILMTLCTYTWWSRKQATFGLYNLCATETEHIQFYAQGHKWSSV